MATNFSATGSSAGLRRAAASSGKRSGLRALVFLVFAGVAALGTALVLTRYLEARTAAVRVPTTPVVVARLDIPLATPLRLESLAVVEWPTASLPDRAVSDPAKLVGRVATTPILKGEAILEAKLASSDAGAGLAALLPPGMRAVAVRVDDVVGVAGFVHPGDHVDVIVTMRPNETGQSPPVSKIFLQSIRVLAVGKDVSQGGRGDSKPVAATVATLMVDSEQSERLALAATKGQILLALRSRVDLDDVVTAGVIPPELLAGAEGARTVVSNVSSSPTPTVRRPSVRRVVAPQPTPVAERQTVEVIRGDLFEKRDFNKESRQ
jgi:pilus assembly protein CpaB